MRRVVLALVTAAAIAATPGTGVARQSYTTKAEKAVERKAKSRYRLTFVFVACIRSYYSNSRFTCPWSGSTSGGDSWDGTAKVKIVNGRAKVLTLGTKP